MNFASWIILLIVIVWIGFAVRSAFFGGGRKKDGCHGGERCDAKTPRDGVALLDDDEKYRLPSACAGCSRGSCAGCASASREVPTPIIREL